MPGAVPRTSTIGLTNVTVPYALQLANKGVKRASLENEALLKGINTIDGFVAYEAVAEAHNLAYEDARVLLQKNKSTRLLSQAAERRVDGVSPRGTIILYSPFMLQTQNMEPLYFSIAPNPEL